MMQNNKHDATQRMSKATQRMSTNEISRMQTPFEIVNREMRKSAHSIVDFYCFASFLIVLSDSEVRFGKISIELMGNIDFQTILTILGHFQNFTF